jgi:hypothetical protein
MSQLPNFTIEEHQRIFNRNQFSLRVLSERVGFLTRENVELMSIIDELQHDLTEARGVLTDLAASSEVESDHAVIHAVPDDSARVPSG